jgi:peptide/nickel transport system permease protein
MAIETTMLPPQLSYWGMVWIRFRRHRMAVAGGVILCVIFLACFLGGPLYCWITGSSPMDQFSAERYAWPSAQHWLGMDDYGRDLLARILYGGQASLSIAVLASLGGMVLGVLVGVLSGYLGGWVDTGLMRFTDFMLAIPWLPFYMVFDKALGKIIGFGFWTVIAIFVVFGWMFTARLVRGVILSIKTTEFVEAARSLGATTWRIMFRHLLINCVPVIIVATTLMIATNLLAEATLSFLGMGVQEPDPSWGNLMMREVATAFAPKNGPFQVVYAGIPLFLSVLAFNFLGDGLRDALDPKLKI